MTDTTISLTDLNNADEEALVRKLQISPRLARRIIALRPYESLGQLDRVWGLDPAVLSRLTGGTQPDAAEELPEAEESPLPPKEKTPWQASLLLVLILLVGAYFRFTGLNWDNGQHQHPDERYISMVVGQIKDVGSVAQYFDTENSPLNPLNFGSYTYGMFPLFLTHKIANWVGMSEYDSVTLAGRAMSGIFDLLAVWMLYILAKQLYDRRVALIAAALGAAAVLPIQLSHYFTVDSFSTVFVLAGFYFALRAIPIHHPDRRISSSNLIHFILFGFVIGLAGACKVNTLPIFGIIGLAGVVRLIADWKKSNFKNTLVVVLVGWFVAALATAVSFRIFQPYAFVGPGFFSLSLNEGWLRVIKEVVNQVAGNSDWPPNTHWTNRPVSYAWVNMVVWGMGIPLGLAAWLGLGWAFKRIWDGNWNKHILPFAWVVGYFLWQNAQFWRYMRYFLPVYPLLILFAAWALVELYDRTRESREQEGFINPGMGWKGAVGILIPALVLVGTYGYAFAFTRIYNRPMTRIAASEWMLENIPAPFNVTVTSPSGSRTYPVAVGNRQMLEPGYAASANIHVKEAGIVSQITTTDVRQVGMSFYFRLTRDAEGNESVTEGRLAINDDNQNEQQMIPFGDVDLNAGQTYYLHYRIQSSSLFSFSNLILKHVDENRPALPLDLNLQAQSGLIEGSLPLTPQQPMTMNRLQIDGFRQVFSPTETTLKVGIYKESNNETPVAEALQTLSFTEAGARLTPTFDFPPVELSGGETYQVRYEITEGAPLRIMGEKLALETSWDDALPLNINKYDAQGGIFLPLNLELYEPDTPEKREAMLRVLNETNYLVIPSNRAYDAMPRLPLRYPLALKYYQTLFDCECMGDELENKAYGLQPPFKSPLGFELVAVFESPPTIGFISFPDQWADESFTVYDHPKVMVFKKTQDFSAEKVAAILNEVDLDQVFFQTPAEYTKAPTAMRLPADRLEAQRNSGDWSAVFDRNSLLNTNQTTGGIVWYLFVFLLGLAIFPLVFIVFGWLPDRGYPLMRMAGLVTIAWMAWMLGSFKVLTFSQLTIWLCIGFVLLLSAATAYLRRNELLAYFASQWKHILGVEALFLALFFVSLSIRLGNPDLWHPWLGGEKPMDFAFFNAVLRAVYFPPEHPWFGGHYVNYYYYGYIVAAIPTKLLGILPAIAYNLILPTWFAMTGIGVFSVAFNLVKGLTRSPEGEADLPHGKWSASLPYFAAVFALVAVMFLGNLYQAVLLWRFLPEASTIGRWDDAPFLEHASAVIEGAGRVLSGEVTLPGNNGRWYFEASRPILNGKPDTPIAEFPYFTYLYGDLHPHMMVMPVYGLVFGWILNLLLWKPSRFKWSERLPGLIAAGLIFGIFRAAHTWDFPTFVGLGALAIIWNVWYAKTDSTRHAIQTIVIYELAFTGIAVLFYRVFGDWFKTEYVSLELWKGLRTPFIDYLYTFGLVLFVMITLLTRELAPGLRVGYQRWVSTARKEFAGIFKGAYLWWSLAMLFVAILLAALWFSDYQILTFGIPLLIGIAYVILLKRGLSPLQQVMWFLFGSALFITLFVDVFVLKGDAGRSNTVFRFYNQAWFMFGFALSLAFVDLLTTMRSWSLPAKLVWSFAFGILFLFAASYPLTATERKMSDRWPDIKSPPHNLDGSAFMLGEADRSNPAIYNDDNRPINLSRDYFAIQFMQDQVKGSPSFVEGHTEEYRWGSRFAIHTGLPSVVGWSWHVRQHNSLLDGAIVDRLIDEVNNFYNTTDIQAAEQFLAKHQVQYIVVGDLERAYYDVNGINKFQEMVRRGRLLVVFGDNTAGTTTIFEVIK
ncbi:MAG: glycosyltransferase family 39 protein [Chloroflexi bacterium]|nr:glycosyltransferase family 39 protein [Chloroflexota bacterium]